MKSAIIDSNGIVLDVLIVNPDEPVENTVPCPDWVGIGMNINAEKPSDFDQERLEKIRQLRFDAYTKEADPLFFLWKRDEATESQWLNKIAEIKRRYPIGDEIIAPALDIPTTEI
jgi:hypothetical protein